MLTLGLFLFLNNFLNLKNFLNSENFFFVARPPSLPCFLFSGLFVWAHLSVLEFYRHFMILAKAFNHSLLICEEKTPWNVRFGMKSCSMPSLLKNVWWWELVCWVDIDIVNMKMVQFIKGCSLLLSSLPPSSLLPSVTYIFNSWVNESQQRLKSEVPHPRFWTSCSVCAYFKG